MDGRMARPGSTWCLLWVQIWWQEWHKSAQTLQSPFEAECSATDGGQVKGECDEWETSVCKKRSLSSLQCNASTEKYWIERNHTTYNRALDLLNSSRRTPCIVRPWNAASDHQLWIWAGEDPWTCLEAFNLSFTCSLNCKNTNWTFLRCANQTKALKLPIPPVQLICVHMS